MREIKFRAWDNETKEMWPYDFSITKDGSLFWVNSSSALDGTFDKTTYDPYFPIQGRFILMQFTGLLDKNGKEIYCSDLIKTPAGTGEVIWEDGCYRIYWNNRDNTTLHDTKSEQMEVVGNKYEGLQNSGKGDII